MDLKSLIKSLGRTLDAEDNEAFNLWTWMPSYRHAKLAFDDYACEYQPQLADLLKEACLIFSTLNFGRLNPETAIIWFSIEPAREKLGDDVWALNDICAFFKDMYQVDVEFNDKKAAQKTQ